MSMYMETGEVLVMIARFGIDLNVNNDGIQGIIGDFDFMMAREKVQVKISVCYLICSTLQFSFLHSAR